MSIHPLVCACAALALSTCQQGATVPRSAAAGAAGWPAAAQADVSETYALDGPASRRQSFETSIYRFASARSLHASLDLQAPRPAAAAKDFMAQDRYDMQTLEATQVVRGDTMYTQARGQLIGMPSAAEMQRIWLNLIKRQESGGR